MSKATKPDLDDLWRQLWLLFWKIDDRHWPAQGPRLREIARQAMALAAAAEEGR